MLFFLFARIKFSEFNLDNQNWPEFSLLWKIKVNHFSENLWRPNQPKSWKVIWRLFQYSFNVPQWKLLNRPEKVSNGSISKILLKRGWKIQFLPYSYKSLCLFSYRCIEVTWVPHQQKSHWYRLTKE